MSSLHFTPMSPPSKTAGYSSLGISTPLSWHQFIKFYVLSLNSSSIDADKFTGDRYFGSAVNDLSAKSK